MDDSPPLVVRYYCLHELPQLTNAMSSSVLSSIKYLKQTLSTLVWPWTALTCLGKRRLKTCKACESPSLSRVSECRFMWGISAGFEVDVRGKLCILVSLLCSNLLSINTDLAYCHVESLLREEAGNKRFGISNSKLNYHLSRLGRSRGLIIKYSWLF